MESIDIEEYYTRIEPNMKSMGGMFSMVFNKQIKDMGISKTASAKEVDELTERVSNAMEFFVGPKMKKTMKRIMKQELRKMAPVYFQKKYGF